VGDKLSDVEFGRPIGTGTALIRSAYWNLDRVGQHADLVGNSLLPDLVAAMILDRGSAFDGLPRL
jgi:hypothetical protein